MIFQIEVYIQQKCVILYLEHACLIDHKSQLWI